MRATQVYRLTVYIILALAGGGLCGCSAVVSSMTSGLSESLASSLVNQNDPETVRQGAPAYLLMIDGFIAEDPENASVLFTGARLYSSYAAAFVDDPERARLLSTKARDYAFRAMCLTEGHTCEVFTAPFDEFRAAVDGVGTKRVDELYQTGAAWATWIQAHRDDWSAVADKARVDEIMRHVLALDEAHDGGNVHLYLGVLATLLPEALGGKPEEGRQHFERAIELSGGRSLLPKVLLARDYARLVFDRKLHDRLCREVVEADPVVPDLTLANVLAQREAQRLLDDSEDYFGE